MSDLEARSKAYFIAAQLTERVAALDSLFAEVAELNGISQEEATQIKAEIAGTVTDYLRSQGRYYRFLEEKPIRKWRQKEKA